jgi:hypothetical protein
MRTRDEGGDRVLVSEGFDVGLEEGYGEEGGDEHEKRGFVVVGRAGGGVDLVKELHLARKVDIRHVGRIERDGPSTEGEGRLGREGRASDEGGEETRKVAIGSCGEGRGQRYAAKEEGRGVPAALVPRKKTRRRERADEGKTLGGRTGCGGRGGWIWYEERMVIQSVLLPHLLLLNKEERLPCQPPSSNTKTPLKRDKEQRLTVAVTEPSF